MAQPKPKTKKEPPKKREYIIADELRSLAKTVIEKEHLMLEPAKIEYLFVYPNISKSIAGKCIKTSRETEFFTKFNYIIEISGELWEKLDEKTRYSLLMEKLLRILTIIDEKSGDWKFLLRKPDMQFFSRIEKKYGVEWVEKIKLSMASINDLTPQIADKITI